MVGLGRQMQCIADFERDYGRELSARTVVRSLKPRGFLRSNWGRLVVTPKGLQAIALLGVTQSPVTKLDTNLASHRLRVWPKFMSAWRALGGASQSFESLASTICRMTLKASLDLRCF